MDTLTTGTCGELLVAATEVRDAGGTTTQMLHTIARMLTGPNASPPQIEQKTVSVFNTAGFYYDDLSSEYETETGATPYPHETATFDDLVGHDQMRVIRYVITSHGEPDTLVEPPAPPVELADHLLNGLRKAATLKVESGPHFGPTYLSIREALVTLLRTQSVNRTLAVESINYALETGKCITEAVAHVDGQL
ncbi:hypothetical protein ABZ470_26695 [Streptosporangium sp. NPDC020072]|uniref:hypothetical protein n=1 Tax=Streptosporangium sp. NPDC020072 TaxID=3154788 RepID=UPI00342DE996